MSDTNFEKQGSTLNVRPKGRLDLTASPVLEKELQQYLDGIQEVIMDFTDVDYISSGGLRTLLAVEQLLEERGGGLKVVHANEYILEIFDMVGFNAVVTVVPD